MENTWIDIFLDNFAVYLLNVKSFISPALLFPHLEMSLTETLSQKNKDIYKNIHCSNVYNNKKIRDNLSAHEEGNGWYMHIM